MQRAKCKFTGPGFLLFILLFLVLVFTSGDVRAQDHAEPVAWQHKARLITEEVEIHVTPPAVIAYTYDRTNRLIEIIYRGYDRDSDAVLLTVKKERYPSEYWDSPKLPDPDRRSSIRSSNLDVVLPLGDRYFVTGYNHVTTSVATTAVNLYLEFREDSDRNGDMIVTLDPYVFYR